MNKTRIGKGQQGYNYKYTDLAQINEYCEERNITYYQYIEPLKLENEVIDYIMTVLVKDGKEEPAKRGVRLVDATLKGIDNPAQEQGSATTYARRYSLLMALGLATEDDDAQSLSRPKEDKINALQLKKLKELYTKSEQAKIEEQAKRSLEELTLKQASDLIEKRS